MSTLSRLMLLAGLLVASPAVADPSGPPTPAPVMPSTVPAKVEVGVLVIRASTEEGVSDPRLAGLQGTLSRLPYKSYKQLDEQSYRLADATAVELPIGTQRTLRVRLVSHNSTEARVEVTLSREGAEPIDTLVTITRNRAFLSVLRGGSEGALLVKLDVRY